MKIILEQSSVTIRINGKTIEITGDELVNLKEEKPVENAVMSALAITKKRREIEREKKKGG